MNKQAVYFKVKGKLTKLLINKLDNPKEDMQYLGLRFMRSKFKADSNSPIMVVVK